MRRPVRPLIYAIALGGATTVAVAWGCALWIEPVPNLKVAPDAADLDFLALVGGPPAVRLVDISRYGHTEIEDARGWPLLAMRGGYDIDSPGGRGRVNATHSAIMLDLRPQLPGVDQTKAPLLPLGIIWRGFILDTLVFAAAWFAILFVPGAIRRSVRRRRGLCIACGYDLHGAPHDNCPECGNATQ